MIKRAILIAGPTASGKSAFALELAKTVDGVIVNADSMQLYRELRIISARPSVDEEAEVEHLLYGVLSAATPFSTGAWLRMMQDTLLSVWESGKLPILVGGTGLYFKALTEGFAELPEIPEESRLTARALADREGVAGLKEALANLGDLEAANTLLDPQRLTRALEVILATGKALSIWQVDSHTPPLLEKNQYEGIVLAPPRAWLHERIARRAELMLCEEGLEEIRALQNHGFSPKLPAMRAIGVSEITAFLNGEADYSETLWKLTVATRQYAKRQETWFKNQMKDWQKVDPSIKINLDNLIKKY